MAKKQVGAEREKVSRRGTAAKTQLTAERPASIGPIDVKGPLHCTRPCFISRYHKEEKTGAVSNPYRWELDIGGYAFLNLVISLRGPAGKYFGAQVRHHHPSASIGPTTTFVIDSETGNLSNAGFELITFNGLRPLLPVFDVIVFSNDNVNFDTIITTAYATVA